jgi:hypothetical protein
MTALRSVTSARVMSKKKNGLEIDSISSELQGDSSSEHVVRLSKTERSIYNMLSLFARIVEIHYF